MQAPRLVSQVKIMGNMDTIFFYSLEGSAILYRATKLGTYLYLLGLALSVPSKTASLQEVPVTRFGRSCSGGLATRIRSFFEGVGRRRPKG